MSQIVVNPATVALVKRFEGLGKTDPGTGRVLPYLDPVGIWTIGWGHAITQQGQFLRGSASSAQIKAMYPDGLSLAEAEALLMSDLSDAGQQVQSVLKVALNANEFGALVSFCFNLGIGNLRKSTLLNKLNGGDRAGAADEFLKWTKAGQQELPGLVQRRQAERSLFLTPMTPNSNPPVAS